MLIHYNDDGENPEDAETGSILSLPSVVKAETESLQKRPLLYERLFAAAPRSDLDGSLIDRLETTTDSEQPSYSSPSRFDTHQMVSLNTSENHESSTPDEPPILDLIENYYNSGGDNKENTREDDPDESSSELSESLDDVSDIMMMQQYVNHVNRRVVEAELVAARMLPKIEEESEEEKMNASVMSMKKLGKRLSSSSLMSVKSAASCNSVGGGVGGGGSALAKVVLTKTARLRMAQKYENKNGRAIAKPVSRLASKPVPCIEKFGHKLNNKIMNNQMLASSTSSSLNSMHTNQFNKN